MLREGIQRGGEEGEKRVREGRKGGKGTPRVYLKNNLWSV